MLSLKNLETPEGLQFYRVSGEFGTVDFCPSLQALRMADVAGKVAALPVSDGLRAAQILFRHGEPGLQAFLNDWHHELAYVVQS